MQRTTYVIAIVLAVALALAVVPVAADLSGDEQETTGETGVLAAQQADDLLTGPPAAVPSSPEQAQFVGAADRFAIQCISGLHAADSATLATAMGLNQESIDLIHQTDMALLEELDSMAPEIVGLTGGVEPNIIDGIRSLNDEETDAVRDMDIEVIAAIALFEPNELVTMARMEVSTLESLEDWEEEEVRYIANMSTTSLQTVGSVPADNLHNVSLLSGSDLRAVPTMTREQRENLEERQGLDEGVLAQFTNVNRNDLSRIAALDRTVLVELGTAPQTDLERVGGLHWETVVDIGEFEPGAIPQLPEYDTDLLASLGTRTGEVLGSTKSFQIEAVEVMQDSGQQFYELLRNTEGEILMEVYERDMEPEDPGEALLAALAGGGEDDGKDEPDENQLNRMHVPVTGPTNLLAAPATLGVALEDGDADEEAREAALAVLAQLPDGTLEQLPSGCLGAPDPDTLPDAAAILDAGMNEVPEDVPNADEILAGATMPEDVPDADEILAGSTDSAANDAPDADEILGSVAVVPPV